MQKNPSYEDLFREIEESLIHSVALAKEAGVEDEQIVVDPGIGFGKRHIDNLLIIKHVEKIKKIGYPVLLGLSRKSFLGRILGNEVEERLIATIAASSYCMLHGVDILRVHDVDETMQMKRVLSTITNCDRNEQEAG